MFQTGRKILCDGYVTKRIFSIIKVLKMSVFLCDGYVIGQK
jgi:hypothetical protein